MAGDGRHLILSSSLQNFSAAVLICLSCLASSLLICPSSFRAASSQD
nr:MAG TPA: hypothetical protein [Inoviridae sp.]